MGIGSIGLNLQAEGYIPCSSRTLGSYLGRNIKSVLFDLFVRLGPPRVILHEHPFIEGILIRAGVSFPGPDVSESPIVHQHRLVWGHSYRLSGL
eukprot:1181291-Prorocentrum_minimum.AAC.2